MKWGFVDLGFPKIDANIMRLSPEDVVVCLLRVRCLAWFEGNPLPCANTYVEGTPEKRALKGIPY